MRSVLSAVAVALGVAALVPTSSGATIAFVSKDCDQGGHPMQGPLASTGACLPSIFRMNDDGSGRKRLTFGASPEDEKARSTLSGEAGPSWSPLGARIVFSRQTAEKTGYERLFVMNADGSGQRRLMPSSSPDVQGERNPAWSPTANLIAFESDGVNSTGIVQSIYVVRGDGSGLRAFTQPVQGQWNTSPVFTADGRRLVYYGDHWHQEAGGQTVQDGAGVFMSDLDGSNTKRLTVGDAWFSSSSLSFSPDGRYVAMTLGDWRLYTMRLDGSELTRRTDRPASHPTWSAVGPVLFYTAAPTTDPSDGRASIYRLDLSHSRAAPARLTDANGANLDPAWTVLGADLPGRPTDSLPPVTILGQDVGLPSAKAGSPNPRLPFLALDPSGIRRVQAAVGLRTRHGCRFLGKAKLGPTTSCAHPQYETVMGASNWANRTRRLPSGRYDVRIRATDRAGNATKHPRRRVVHLF